MPKKGSEAPKKVARPKMATMQIGEINVRVPVEDREFLQKELDDMRQTASEPRHDPTLSLMQRILWVRDRVTRLGKDTQVSAGAGSYKAITHDKVTAALRPKLVQAGIFTKIHCIEASDAETGAVTGKGRAIVQHRALFAIKFVNVFNAQDFETVHQWAHADDYGDKAPGKATSYAMKYALLKMFMIETGEDDEERADAELADGGKAATILDNEDKLRELWALADELFGDDAELKLNTMAKRRFFVDRYQQIPLDKFDDACRGLHRHKAKLEEQRNG